jgi:hypothetical protein
MPPKLTQPLRPAARYRPGKAPVPVADDSDYSDQEEQEAQGTAADDGDDDDDDDQQVTEFRTTTTAGKPKGTAALNVALKQVEVDQTGKVKVGGRDEVGRTEMESSEGEYGPFTPWARSCPVRYTDPDPCIRRNGQRGRAGGQGARQARLSTKSCRSGATGASHYPSRVSRSRILGRRLTPPVNRSLASTRPTRRKNPTRKKSPSNQSTNPCLSPSQSPVSSLSRSLARAR